MERRHQGLTFDWTINLGNIVSFLLLVATLIRYGNSINSYLKDISLKTNIMWSEFIKTNPQANQYLTTLEDR